MDVREKLVELLNNSFEKQSEKRGLLTAPHTADDLIANGVTVQEWISVEDRLPKPETDVIVFGGGFIDILTYRHDRRGNICFMYQDECGYWTERFRPPVTHWMPLPEPPDMRGEDDG